MTWFFFQLRFLHLWFWNGKMLNRREEFHWSRWMVCINTIPFILRWFGVEGAAYGQDNVPSSGASHRILSFYRSELTGMRYKNRLGSFPGAVWQSFAGEILISARFASAKSGKFASLTHPTHPSPPSFLCFCFLLRIFLYFARFISHSADVLLFVSPLSCIALSIFQWFSFQWFSCDTGLPPSPADYSFARPRHLRLCLHCSSETSISPPRGLSTIILCFSQLSPRNRCHPPPPPSIGSAGPEICLRSSVSDRPGPVLDRLPPNKTRPAVGRQWPETQIITNYHTNTTFEHY